MSPRCATVEEDGHYCFAVALWCRGPPGALRRPATRRAFLSRWRCAACLGTPGRGSLQSENGGHWPKS